MRAPHRRRRVAQSRHGRAVLSGSVARPIISGITADKQRFLFRLGTKQGLPSINVVLNWRQALQEK